MKKITTGMIWTQIVLQTLLPVPSIAKTRQPSEHLSQAASPTSPFSVDRQNNRQSDDVGEVLPYSTTLSQGARMLATGNTADSARSLAVGAASGKLQQWLSQFGTARIELNMDRHGSWSHSSGDLLVPLYDNREYLLFVQGGMRNPADRLTGNLGLGVRTFWQNGWMYGGNVFFDEDFTGHNRRVGIGGEAWRDYLRLSANTYVGTTNWHTSRDFDGTWQEKPADGYDVRAQGWLPALPQLGAKLVWEQYYGQQVALFNKDHLQRNPYTVTAGVEYTPVPLVTLGADQKQGSGEHDTQLTLGLHWQFGHDWRWQLDPANVQSMRTLAGSRYELVDRNNEIVLQYRKRPEQGVSHLAMTVVTDNSPADGMTRNVLQVLATNRNGQPVRSAPLSWSVPSDGSATLPTASAVTDENGLASATLTSMKVQTVPVTVQSGNVSASQNSHFMAVAVSKIALSVAQDNAVADGNSADAVTATLTDSNGRPVAGQTVTWTVPEGVTLREKSSTSDNSGKVTVHLTATVAGSAVIRAAAGNQSAEGTVHFTGNAASAKVETLSVTTDGSPSDGKTANVAQVTVTDANGNTLAGQTVSWKADKPTVTFGQSAVTDASGQTTVSYTDTVAESLTLTATLTNGNSATVSSLFVSDRSSARLKSLDVTSGAKASGTDVNTATVIVTDANGNPLANTAVTFSVTGSAKLNAATVNTDGSGRAQVTLTDVQAETVRVTVKLATGSSMTKESSFVADLNSAQLTVTTTTGALADGSAVNTATVTLKDRNGTPLPGQAVTLAATGDAKLSATSGNTDGNGQVVVALTDTAAETVTLTASLSNGKQATAQAAFTGFSVTELKTSTASVKANGMDSATLTATVKDARGKVVPDTPVTLSVTGRAELSDTTATTNASGQVQVTLTDGTGETVTVTAKAQNSRSDAGKTTTVTFVASTITGITVNNTSGTSNTRVFTSDSGFPKTGFAGASFTLSIDNGTLAVTDYTWSSSQPWVSVSNGTVTFTGKPTSGTKSVTITARPKGGKGTVTWAFTLENWFTLIGGAKGIAETDSTCSNLGQSVPSKDLLDYIDMGGTRVGSLWSEWANSVPEQGGVGAVWASETGRNSRYYMFLNDGHIYDNAASEEGTGEGPYDTFGAACVTAL